MKKILKTLALATLALALCTNIYAQEQKPAPKKPKMTPEQMATIQAKDIAMNLGFDDATTEKFVKTFCDYRAEIRTANKAKQEAAPKISRKDMTEQQVEEQIKMQFTTSRKIVDIREKYYGEFRKYLNPRQIQRVYELEKKQTEKMKAQQAMRKAYNKNGKGGKPNMPKGK